MHYSYDKEKYRELSIDKPNYITEKNKIWILPMLNTDYAMVEIINPSLSQIIVDSQGYPIFYRGYSGRIIHIGGDYGNTIDLNPKFIWSKDRWFLSTHGYVLFAEIEMNLRQRETE